MFDSDFIHEITETITRQKWRSVMTAFGVFWGMLIRGARCQMSSGR